MTIIDRLKALFSRSEVVQAEHAEDIPDPTGRPRSDQDFEEVKDDDALARGSTLAGPTLGPGTAEELREEFESDQEPPSDRTP